MYADYRNESKVYNYINGLLDTTIYGIVNNSKVWIDNTSDVFHMKVITENVLELYNNEILSVSNYDETTIRFEKILFSGRCNVY